MLFLCYVCTLLSFCSHVAAMIPLIVLTSEKFMSIFRASWYRKWVICHVCTGNCPLSSACFIVILVWMHEFSLKVIVYVPVLLSYWTFLGPVLKSEVLPPIKAGESAAAPARVRAFPEGCRKVVPILQSIQLVMSNVGPELFMVWMAPFSELSAQIQCLSNISPLMWLEGKDLRSVTKLWLPVQVRKALLQLGCIPTSESSN